MVSDATLAYGARVTKALLGVDALYREESGDGDGLAVLNMDTAGTYAADTFGGYLAARMCWEELRTDAAGLPEEDRRVYYDELCHSTLAFIDWRRNGLSFRSQLADFLHVPAKPVPDDLLDRAAADIASQLTEMGYLGDLAAQAAAWEERNRVPPEAVHEVLTGLLSEAWDRTEGLLGGMPAPKTDGMEVRTVTGVAFNARCDYARRTIELNVDPVLTGPGLKHLAVHEGYPGHYLQFKLRETMAAQGTAAPDVLLSVVNSASSSVFEGIADHGMAMIRWGDTADDRLQGSMNAYRAAIATGAAWRLHELGWTRDAVADWLRERSLVGGEGWVANRMAFIEAPSRAALIWSYWWGEQSVAPAYAKADPGSRSAFIEYLYGRMHSIRSVGMFQGAGGLPWREGDEASWS